MSKTAMNLIITTCLLALCPFALLEGAPSALKGKGTPKPQGCRVTFGQGPSVQKNGPGAGYSAQSTKPIGSDFRCQPPALSVAPQVAPKSTSLSLGKLGIAGLAVVLVGGAAFALYKYLKKLQSKESGQGESAHSEV